MIQFPEKYFSKVLILFVVHGFTMFGCREKPQVPARYSWLEIQKTLAGQLPPPAKVAKPYKIELPPGAPPFPVDPGNPLTEEGVRLGRWLFYDPLLSRGHNVACSTCHIQKLAFTDGKQVSPGTDGENVGRNAMSLVNLAWGRNFFWDGRARDLKDLSLLPISHPKEMAQSLDQLVWKLAEHPAYPKLFLAAFGDDRISLARVAKALTQFMRSIVSFGAPVDFVRMSENGHFPEDKLSPELKSYLLKNMPPRIQYITSLCGQCHSDAYHGSKALYGGTRMRNNGLAGNKDPGMGKFSSDPQNMALFKVPELRNIEVTAPYMHDGRFATLDDVLDHYDAKIEDNPHLSGNLRDGDNKPIRLKMTAQEKATVKFFMVMMTDKSLLSDPRYSNPFLVKSDDISPTGLKRGFYVAAADAKDRNPNQVAQLLSHSFPHLAWFDGKNLLAFIKPADAAGFLTFYSRLVDGQGDLLNAKTQQVEWNCEKIQNQVQKCSRNGGKEFFEGRFFAVSEAAVKKRGLYHAPAEIEAVIQAASAVKY